MWREQEWEAGWLQGPLKEGPAVDGWSPIPQAIRTGPCPEKMHVTNLVLRHEDGESQLGVAEGCLQPEALHYLLPIIRVGGGAQGCQKGGEGGLLGAGGVRGLGCLGCGQRVWVCACGRRGCRCKHVAGWAAGCTGKVKMGRPQTAVRRWSVWGCGSLYIIAQQHHVCCANWPYQPEGRPRKRRYRPRSSCLLHAH